jgi:hypothetical protein
MDARLDEAEKQILATLLADFADRDLNADHLNSGYEGPQVQDLINSVCTGNDITKVDFDIALSDLEKKSLISTGPYEKFKNEPGDRLIIIGGYSKREYAGLTELGYKTARQPANRPSDAQRIVNNVHISGGQFSNLQLATGNNVVQKIDSTSGADSDILNKLIAILEKQGQVVSIEQREILTSAVEEANEGNGKEAKKLLEKVCGPAWTAVQPVIWPIFGELLKKSLGL